MEFKNINPNGDIVVASNLNNVNFFFFENCENRVHIQTLYVIFSKKFHVCPNSLYYSPH
jgi:hypothetical protein